MWKLVIAGVLVAHGLGHTMGFFPTFGWIRSAFWTGDSWLITPVLGDAARWVAMPIWIVTTAGFVAAGLAVYGIGLPTGMWRQLALLSAIVSLTGLALFPNALASSGSVISALVVDGLIVGSAVLSWPSSELVGP